MRTRGRRSAAEQATVIIGEFGKRPDPLAYLTERQAEIWRETTASEPIEFFGTAALRGLLADYCRHRQAAEVVSSLVDSFKPEWLKNGDGVERFHALLKMREAETRSAVAMARSLKLTNQSRYTAMAASTAANAAAKGPRPWEG